MAAEVHISNLKLLEDKLKNVLDIITKSTSSMIEEIEGLNNLPKEIKKN